MKKMMIVLCIALMAGAASEAKAQVRTTDNNLIQVNPTDYYSNRNGTYPFQGNQNNNMGTSPNNAVYKNEAAFYNKDNTVQNFFPMSNGQSTTPGSQGNNNTGNYNNNTSGNYSNGNFNVRPGPVYMNNTNSNGTVIR